MNSSGEAMADRASVTKAKDGRGGFFAVDRRAWHMVCNLGLNTAVAYLVAARGTGGDNRTTKWSTNAIEQRTNISRSRAKAAIHALEAAGLLHRDPASKPSFPKYKLVPAHEVPGCEGCRPPALAGEHARVHAALGTDWTEVPKSAASGSAYARWGSLAPRRTADELVKSGHVEVWTGGRHFRVVRYDAEAAARPDWIWLPNALVDGAAQETTPAEMARQTGNVLVLRLLVNLYGSQILDEDGGIHFRRIRQQYARHKVGEQGPFVVWGFVPEQAAAFRDALFVAPHFAAANDDVKRTAAWAEFWKCWNHLLDMGLVEFVAHLVEADTPEGEIIHPVALHETGLEIERELARAATLAGAALTTPGQQRWAFDQGVRLLVPIERRKEGVQVMGIARLRYRPRTSRTLAFVARETDWQAALDRLLEIAATRELATSRGHQG